MKQKLEKDPENEEIKANAHWKRILLLVIGIVIHNIPEGLAVGVTFGAVDDTSQVATFESARNLAIGIGIQNFPEGLAVSLPLHASGFSMFKAFWFGQLSGMVEPIFGVLGAFAVSAARLILPYALSFAAGAMMYIVVDDIIPEAHASGNGKIATWGATIGFLVMMVLEVTLG
uniref:Zinc transporter ZIP11 n=1 Tax=Megaselia scalaris TaxID=36166 RepID=T1GES2_MEGSC